MKIKLLIYVTIVLLKGPSKDIATAVVVVVQLLGGLDFPKFSAVTYPVLVSNFWQGPGHPPL